MSNGYQQSVFEPERWGLSTESTQNLAPRLFGFWLKFQERFKNKTRDTSEYAYSYMSGQLRMTEKRNFANIGCNTGVSEQNMQHFMSNSPWSAWAVIQQVQAEIAATPGLGQNGVLIRFEAICCDDLYGQSGDLRAEMNGANYVYMADVPQNTQVYLKQPVVGVPEAQSGRPGRKPCRYCVLSANESLKVSDVARLEDTNWCRVRVRDTERGELNDGFAARRIWTIHDNKPVQEWLVMRREGGGKCTYSMSNASPNTPLNTLHG